MWELFISFFTNALLYIYSLVVQVPFFEKVGAFGISIILFTALIRLLTHPLMASQIKSSAKMQELTASKEYQAMQKKYEKDKEKLAAEQMNLYKQAGVNPFSSCLTSLIQFPILIGLYQSITRALAVSPLQLLQLTRSVWLENAADIIPLHSNFLWMNLGLPEGVKLSFLPFAIPTLAILVAVTTFVQSKLTMPPSTNPNDPNAQTMKMMTYMMPLMFFWFSLSFNSGLAVYFLTSNLLGIVQYAALGKINWKNLFSTK